MITSIIKCGMKWHINAQTYHWEWMSNIIPYFIMLAGIKAITVKESLQDKTVGVMACLFSREYPK